MSHWKEKVDGSSKISRVDVQISLWKESERGKQKEGNRDTQRERERERLGSSQASAIKVRIAAVWRPCSWGVFRIVD